MELNITKLFEDLARSARKGLRATPDQLIDIDTFIENGIILSREGHLCSIVKLKGCKIEDNTYDSYNARLEVLATDLNSFFVEDNHKIHISFRKDIGTEKQEIGLSTENSRQRAKKMGILGADEIFDDQIDFFSKVVKTESVYMCLWTTEGVVPKRTRQAEDIDLKKEKKDVPVLENSQSLIGTYKALKSAHVAFVNKVVGSLRNFGTYVDLLARDDAMRSMATLFKPYLKSGARFSFPDTSRYFRAPTGMEQKDDVSFAFSEPLSYQLLQEDEIEVDTDDDIVRIEDQIFTTFEVKTPPLDLVVFNDLGDSIMKDVPYQMSFWIDSGVSSMFYWKKLLSAIPFPSSNKRIKYAIAAVDKLKELKMPNVEYKISVSTWARTYEDLMDAKLYLKSEVSSWGNSAVRNYRGCPLDALLSSTAGVNSRTFGSTVYAPLAGVLPQLPLARRPRFWDESSLNFFTPGGTLFPFTPRSEKQLYWNIGLCATMGSGKSVLMQQIAFAHFLSGASKNEMPMIGYVDNGFSAKVFIEMLAALSPQEMKHRYMHISLKNSQSHGFNILTTLPGLRRPDVTQFNQIVSLYTSFCVPAGKGAETHSDLHPLISQLVRDAYLNCSDEVNPKVHREGRNPKIDKIVNSLDAHFKNATFFEIVDELMTQRRVLDATFIQRYAVPTLKDVIEQLTLSESVKNNYAGVIGYNEQNLVDYVRRSLTSAIDRYPIVSGETVIDVDTARFIVIDLNAVAKGGTPEADKDAEVFYTLARYMVSRNMFVYEDDLLEVVPEKYKTYYTNYCRRLDTIPKLLAYDEFHRVKSEGLLTQIEQEMREGRKWKLSIMIASQLLKDFSRFESLLSSTFILRGDAGTPEEIQKIFGLNKDAMRYLMTKCHGPQGADGANFIVKLKTTEGDLVQKLNSRLYPFIYWMTTSDSLDKELKNAVAGKIGIKDAINSIRRVYPFGVKTVVADLQINSPDELVRDDPISYMASVVMDSIIK
ncbi:hypothetical protein [Photobacterium kishitanii]|uniref:Type IV secretion protein IcmB n=1 Tax=Photobacterium kishitanii TaxID=318456 RepID=A0A2T3KAY0_9GAMM|nr:hypothetical protein [Photobacterium kishitanii]PSU89768.1 hypothetical protein C9J27_24105 [Photobacterium kishitanii]